MSRFNESFIPHLDLGYKAADRHSSLRAVQPINNHLLVFNLASATIFKPHTFSNQTGNLARKLLVATLLALICSPASSSGTGTLDLGICCMQAARSQFPATITQTPWDACGVDPDFDFSKPDPSPSVNVTIRWCMEHCAGWQASTSEQVLQPLTVWITPALALLVLCSIGEDEEKNNKEENDKEGHPFQGLCYQLKEYIILLGDPASAICGALSELWIDTWLAMELMKMGKKPDDPDTSVDELVIGIAMLSSQTSFRPPIFSTAAAATAERSEEKHQRTEISRMTSASQDKIQPIEPLLVHGTPSYEGGDLRELARAAFSDHYFKERLVTGIKTVLKAKIDFVNGVALPVVLALAATASTFHDAYLRLGDNETAHNLAFGVWFSWLIVLAVISNSYVASVNPGLAHEAIGNLAKFSRYTVPLRKRAKNTIQWREWVIDLIPDRNGSDKVASRRRFLPGYLMRQLVGWICVAFACACAATISYRTVPVGIGCRSFTFLIYGLMTFVVASLMAVRDWVRPESRTWKSLRHVYGFLVGLTALVLFLSVLAEWVGLFRNCWCMHFGPLSDLVELSQGTELSIKNAKTTWIPLGYVAYTGAWIVCAIAVAFRTFVNFRIQDMMERQNGVFHND